MFGNMRSLLFVSDLNILYFGYPHPIIFQIPQFHLSAKLLTIDYLFIISNNILSII